MLLGIIRRKKKGREKKKIFDKRKITKKGTVKIEAKKKKKVLGMRPGVVVDRSAVKVIMTTWIGL